MADQKKTYTYVTLAIAAVGVLMSLIGNFAPWWTVWTLETVDCSGTMAIGLYSVACVSTCSKDNKCTFPDDIKDIHKGYGMSVTGVDICLDLSTTAAVVGMICLYMMNSRSASEKMKGQYGLLGTGLLLLAGFLGLLGPIIYAADFGNHTLPDSEISKILYLGSEPSLGASFALSIVGGIVLLLSGCAAGFIYIKFPNGGYFG